MSNIELVFLLCLVVLFTQPCTVIGTRSGSSQSIHQGPVFTYTLNTSLLKEEVMPLKSPLKRYYPRLERQLIYSMHQRLYVS